MTKDNEKKELNKVPRLTLGLISAWFILVVLVGLGIVLPGYKRMQTAKHQRIAKMLILEKQKKTYPLYAQVTALGNFRFEPQLPMVERTPLSRDKISSLSNIFNDIALRHNMKLARNTLDTSSLKTSSNSISMDIQFTGSLFNYRGCLISLSELPCFSRIEKIKIRTGPGNMKEFMTKILITIDPK